MKLFHTENGREVVYVQMQDIMQLNQSDMFIPASIYSKGITIVDDSNRFKFVRFDNEQEVDFFKKIDFILDYDYYKNFTDRQLDKEWKKYAIQANEIAKRWNSISPNERNQNKNLLQEHENLEYMLSFLSEIYAIKHGKMSMPFLDFVKLPRNPKKRRLFGSTM